MSWAQIPTEGPFFDGAVSAHNELMFQVELTDDVPQTLPGGWNFLWMQVQRWAPGPTMYGTWMWVTSFYGWQPGFHRFSPAYTVIRNHMRARAIYWNGSQPGFSGWSGLTIKHNELPVGIHPEKPAVMRNVEPYRVKEPSPSHYSQYELEWTRPSLDAVQSSSDGRVVISTTGGIEGDAGVVFALMVPEVARGSAPFGEPPFAETSGGEYIYDVDRGVPVAPVDPDLPTKAGGIIRTASDCDFKRTPSVASPPKTMPEMCAVHASQLVNRQVSGPSELGMPTLCDGTPLKLGEADGESRDNPFVCNDLGTQATTGLDRAGNPLALDHDCYDLTIIQGGSDGEVWGTDVRVVVKDPKTVNARLANVYTLDESGDQWEGRDAGYEITEGAGVVGEARELLGPSRYGWTKNNSTGGGIATFEPVATADGRLWAERASSGPLGDGSSAISGVYYSVYPALVDEGGVLTPTRVCDAKRWAPGDGTNGYGWRDPDAPASVQDNRFRSINAMYYDWRAVVDQYGLSRYEFRDHQGALISIDFDLGTGHEDIANGVLFNETYPWIDRAGDNLFFLQRRAPRNSFGALSPSEDTTFSRYPVRCKDGTITTCDIAPPRSLVVGDGSDGPETEVGNKRGLGMVGLWSYGKMVTFDGLVNHTDYGYTNLDVNQRQIMLYREADGETPVWVSPGVGATRQKMVAAINPNGEVVASMENLLNHVPEMRPRTPRDVVWFMGTGKATGEVVFDDYIDKHMLIYSDGVPAKDCKNKSQGECVIFDGWDQSHHTDKLDLTLHSPLDPFVNEVRLENGASSPLLAQPSYGAAQGVRIEPVALGGVNGKGVWMSGSSATVTYTVPQQTATTGDWFVSLFVDLREEDTSFQQLIAFPDGGSVEIARDAGGVITVRLKRDMDSEVVALPLAATHPRSAPEGYNHLGFAFPASGPGAVYLNGYKVQDLPDTSPLASWNPIEVVDADFVVGGGFRGWWDELRVMDRIPGFGDVCSQARGRMYGFGGATGHDITAQAGAYSGDIHDDVSDALSAHGLTTYDNYACHHDYTTDNALTKTIDDPEDAGDYFGVSGSLLFPEGAGLVATTERPEADQNAFCTSCHDGGFSHGLGLEAITDPATVVVMAKDPRRRPLEAYPFLRGIAPPTSSFWLNEDEIEYLFPDDCNESTLAGECLEEAFLLDYWLAP